MILGIDASNIRAGGGITHLVELLRAANPQAHAFSQVVVWSGAATLNKIEERDWLRREYDPMLDRVLCFRAYWQRFKLAKLAKAAGCDVLFVPGGSNISKYQPMVTMSQNLLPFEWQELRRYGLSWLGLKLRLLRFIQGKTFCRANGIIFLTQYARQAVSQVTGVPCARIAIIPHGITPKFFHAPRLQRQPHEFNDAQPCRFLYVSIVDVYKHQWHVAEAVAQLRISGFPVTLDLVGPAYAPAMARLNETLQRVDPEARFIRYRGEIPHDELHKLYVTADINVFASSCENMPNILLEGMASGLPIACSNRGPMTEVLGDAGIYFDPESVKEIAAALQTLYEHPDLRNTLAQRAYDKACNYSWRQCAHATFEFLSEEVEAGSAPSREIRR